MYVCMCYSNLEAKRNPGVLHKGEWVCCMCLCYLNLEAKRNPGGLHKGEWVFFFRFGLKEDHEKVLAEGAKAF